MLLWAAVVWSSCLLSRWLGRQGSVLFVYCETVENHFPISLDEAETTEHERFSATAADWSRPALHADRGDGASHWQIMMHQNGHRSRLVQADRPMFNDLMSDAGAMASSFRLSSNGIQTERVSLQCSTKAPKHQENIDSDPKKVPDGGSGLKEQSLVCSFKGLVIPVTALNVRQRADMSSSFHDFTFDNKHTKSAVCGGFAESFTSLLSVTMGEVVTAFSSRHEDFDSFMLQFQIVFSFINLQYSTKNFNLCFFLKK